MSYSIKEYQAIVEGKLRSYFVIPEDQSHHTLADAMRYSLLAGGKRIRPILILEFSRISGGVLEESLPVACAIEMLHTYSLIHDDLPCMDDDELRRGKPTNHVIYGECTATLAGDCLQAEAFSCILRSNLSPERRVRCAAILAEAAGLEGICGGQYLDMVGETLQLSAQQLDEINSRKTGALLSAACAMGVAAAGGSEEKLQAAAAFGRLIGAAFQIRDDMLDVISTEEELGKPIGSDQRSEKNTYMAVFGQEKCSSIITELTERAKALLSEHFSDTEFLFALADSLAARIK